MEEGNICREKFSARNCEKDKVHPFLTDNFMSDSNCHQIPVIIKQENRISSAPSPNIFKKIVDGNNTDKLSSKIVIDVNQNLFCKVCDCELSAGESLAEHTALHHLCDVCGFMSNLCVCICRSKDNHEL